MNLQSSRKTKGETILETLIAFVILGIGIAFSGVIMGSSLRNMDNYKNRIIALNVAREGIEAVRNIRDTNWLIYDDGDNLRYCWNFTPLRNPTSIAEKCQYNKTNNLIKPGRYIVYKQGLYDDDADTKQTYRWRLDSLNADDTNTIFPIAKNKGEKFKNTNDQQIYIWDGSQWKDMRTLYLVDIDLKKDTDLDKDSKNDKDLYNHIFVEDKDNLGEVVKNTVLKREIIIEYVANNGWIIKNPNTMDIKFNRMRITSIVTWKKGRNTHKVELKTHITDYFEREELSH